MRKARAAAATQESALRAALSAATNASKAGVSATAVAEAVANAVKEKLFDPAPVKVELDELAAHVAAAAASNAGQATKKK
jgi:RNA 3'-terminal phosphate cyclase